nr:hypothetical protein GCM10020092_001830 [Actinoplanes digitatis]
MRRRDPVRERQRQAGLADAGQADEGDAARAVVLRPREPGEQLDHVAVAADQVGGRRQAHESGRRGGLGLLTTRGGEKRQPVRPGEAERGGQQLHRGALRPGRATALEVADRADADPGPGGQLVLGEFRPLPVSAQHGVESRTDLARPVLGRHAFEPRHPCRWMPHSA